MTTTATLPPHAVLPNAKTLNALASCTGLLLYCGLLFFVNLGDRDLTSSHEARAAQNAQMVLDGGHWLVPQLFDRHVELQKPPLYYWLVALIGWLNGGQVDVWAVRLPAAISGLICVLFLYYLGVKCRRPLAGLLAAFVLASCIHFTWLARVGRIDMPLTATITIALGAFHIGNRAENSRFRWHLLGYASLGVGLLLKGPIALVLPAMVAGANWLIRDRRLTVRSITLWWGVPLSLAIALPWYIAANIYTDNKLWEVFFWYHNVERGLGGSEILKEYPWWYYTALLAFNLLPWSLVVPLALWGFFRHRELRHDVEAGLGLIWFAAIAIFLSCMSFKRADYLLPAFPGMAIFLGAVMERWAIMNRDGIRLKQLAIGIGGVLVLCATGWIIYDRQSAETAWPYREIANEIRGQTRGPVIFFRAETHVLTWHVGRPVDTILEWENLEWWVNRPRPVYFVMPADCADQWRDHLADGSLEEVLRTRAFATGKRGRPLVVLRNRVRLASNP